MKQYGLIGYPLGHSFSGRYFNAKFAAENIDAEYINFEIRNVGEMLGIIRSHPELLGLNVTIPYKEEVIPYMDALSENARRTGAVNVIRIERFRGKTRLTGYNSDLTGFKLSIDSHLDEGHSRALVLGTGGAAKSIFAGLEDLGLIPTYVTRSPASEGMLTYRDLDAGIMETHTVIVNCTPVGMYPEVGYCPDIPYQFLYHRHLLYDLIYNPGETLFLRRGKERGSSIINGLEMLLLQAFETWNILTGSDSAHDSCR
ncbi:MAG: shikimate dehydrogenase [Dysgonamonadaceae bacterium]|jgi:shikimate dehydrogenase|nr:shikimate dehydrogenase [Dysgonamonadaceae bacterium]